MVKVLKIASNFLFIYCGKYWEQNNFCQCFSFFLWGCTYDHSVYFAHKKKLRLIGNILYFPNLLHKISFKTYCLLLHSVKWLTSIWILFAYHLILYQNSRKYNFVFKFTRKDFDILRFLNILVRWKICLDECIYIWCINCIFIVWTRNYHFWKYLY